MSALAESIAAMNAHHYMNADGFCHAGDMFEHGTPFVALFTGEQVDELLAAQAADYEAVLNAGAPDA